MNIRAKPSAVKRRPAPGILGGAAYSGDVSPSLDVGTRGVRRRGRSAPLAVLAFRASERRAARRPPTQARPRAAAAGSAGVLGGAAARPPSCWTPATAWCWPTRPPTRRAGPRPATWRTPSCASWSPRSAGVGAGPRGRARAAARPARPRHDLRLRPGRAPRRTTSSLVLVDDLTEARRVEAVRRDFVANVSHELKTPIGALRAARRGGLGRRRRPGRRRGASPPGCSTRRTG